MRRMGPRRNCGGISVLQDRKGAGRRNQTNRRQDKSAAPRAAHVVGLVDLFSYLATRCGWRRGQKGQWFQGPMRQQHFAAAGAWL